MRWNRTATLQCDNLKKRCNRWSRWSRWSINMRKWWRKRTATNFQHLTKTKIFRTFRTRMNLWLVPMARWVWANMKEKSTADRNHQHVNQKPTEMLQTTIETNQTTNSSIRKILPTMFRMHQTSNPVDAVLLILCHEWSRLYMTISMALCPPVPQQMQHLPTQSTKTNRWINSLFNRWTEDCNIIYQECKMVWTYKLACPTLLPLRPLARNTWWIQCIGRCCPNFESDAATSLLCPSI